MREVKVLKGRMVHCAWLLLLTLLTTGVLAEEKQTKLRRFADGPLRIEEFKGKPDRLSGDAYTANRVDFKYDYVLTGKGGRVEARLKTFEAYSLFLRESSWWKSSAREFLLDHEQGHFDIAEAAARRAQLGFDKVFAEKKVIRAYGATKEEAIKKLSDKISRVMKVANEQATEDNREYDAITSHGMRPRIQAEQRHVHKATLDRLAKELEAVRNRRKKPKLTK